MCREEIEEVLRRNTERSSNDLRLDERQLEWSLGIAHHLADDRTAGTSSAYSLDPAEGHGGYGFMLGLEEDSCGALMCVLRLVEACRVLVSCQRVVYSALASPKQNFI